MSPGEAPRAVGLATLDAGRSTAWLAGAGESADVVMSSRIRLARNIAGMPFMGRATREDRQRVLDACRGRLLTCGMGDAVMWVDLHETSKVDRSLLVERHLISPQHAVGRAHGTGSLHRSPRAVAVSMPDERASVMVNEEDHLRIQVVHPGLDLGGALAVADAIDDRLEEKLDFAFHARFGYLTACPTNVGTGARLSVMLHLPGLRMTGELQKVKNAADDMGLAFRGFYGEDSEGSGDFFQLSNQTTLGRSEQVLLREMEREIVPRVVEYERTARAVLVDQRRDTTADEIHRALGVLLHAQLLATTEAMQLLSRVRLGVLTGILPGLREPAVNHLMLLLQPAHLQRLVGRELSQRERRQSRAEIARQRLQTALERQS